MLKFNSKYYDCSVSFWQNLLCLCFLQSSYCLFLYSLQWIESQLIFQTKQIVIILFTQLNYDQSISKANSFMSRKTSSKIKRQQQINIIQNKKIAASLNNFYSKSKQYCIFNKIIVSSYIQKQQIQQSIIQWFLYIIFMNLYYMLNEGWILIYLYLYLIWGLIKAHNFTYFLFSRVMNFDQYFAQHPQFSMYTIKDLSYRKWVSPQFAQSDYVRKSKKITATNLEKFNQYNIQNISSKDISNLPLIISSNQILKYINMVRTNPKSFLPFLNDELNCYINNTSYKKNGKIFRTQQGKQAVKDAIQFLQEQASLNPIQMDQCLYYAASDHNMDINYSYLEQHIGNDESDPYQRVKRRHGRQFELDIAECVDIIPPQDGPDFAKSLIVKWIIDSGDQQRANRVNIFRENMKAFGGSMIKDPMFKSYKAVILMCQDHLEAVNFQGIYENGLPKVQPVAYLKNNNKQASSLSNHDDILSNYNKSSSKQRDLNSINLNYLEKDTFKKAAILHIQLNQGSSSAFRQSSSNLKQSSEIVETNTKICKKMVNGTKVIEIVQTIQYEDGTIKTSKTIV